MTARDMVLAALTSVVWGFAFVAVKFGLESFSAPPAGGRPVPDRRSARLPGVSTQDPMVVFALLAPCTGVLSSALIFREVFSPMRYAGMALILAGLAVVVLPTDWVGSLTPGGRQREGAARGHLKELGAL